MTTTTTRPHTETACPSWCTVEHEGPGGFHAGPNLAPVGHPARLWQDDSPGARPGVIVNGELLTDAQAHELGMALVRAADELTPASPSGLNALEAPLEAINAARGSSHTLESVAVECGVDLAEATKGDVTRMACYIGGTLMGANR